MQLHLTFEFVEVGAKLLFDMIRLAFLDHQHVILTFAEVVELIAQQRIGDVQHIERHLGMAVDIRKAQPLQGTDDGVVHAALDNDAQWGFFRAEELV